MTFSSHICLNGRRHGFRSKMDSVRILDKQFVPMSKTVRVMAKTKLYLMSDIFPGTLPI